MPSAAPVDRIPAHISGLAGAIAAGGRTVTRAFVDRWAGAPDTATVAYLPHAACRFRIVFTRSTSDTILFFFHRDGPVRVLFDASITFAVETLPDDLIAPRPPAVDDIGIILVLPSFLVGQPTRQQLDQFGFGPASTVQNTILLTLGPEGGDILAVMNPEAGRRARVRYSPGGVPGPEEPRRGRYSLSWVVAFVKTLGAWIETDLRAGDRRPALLRPDNVSVPGILFHLLDAFVRARQTLERPGPAILDLPDIFQKTYTVNNYFADLVLRLAPDGTLTDADDFDSTQLLLRLRTTDEGETAEITAVPGELAVSGPLLASFIEVCLFNVDDSVWADLLDIDRIFADVFFQTARDNAAVFRIARTESSDRNVMILTGMLQGTMTTVVLVADFVVDMTQDPPTVDVTDTDSIEILARADAGDLNASVAFEAVEFLLKYLVNFRHWMGIIG